MTEVKVRGFYKVQVKCSSPGCPNIFGLPDRPIPGPCGECMLKQFLDYSGREKTEDKKIDAGNKIVYKLYADYERAEKVSFPRQDINCLSDLLFSGQTYMVNAEYDKFLLMPDKNDRIDDPIPTKKFPVNKTLQRYLNGSKYVGDIYWMYVDGDDCLKDTEHPRYLRNFFCEKGIIIPYSDTSD